MYCFLLLTIFLQDAAGIISCTVGWSLNVTHWNRLSVIFRPSITYFSPDISGRLIFFGFTARVSLLKVYCAILVSAYDVRNRGSRYYNPAAVNMSAY